jgi:hypothetical protein
MADQNLRLLPEKNPVLNHSFPGMKKLVAIMLMLICSLSFASGDAIELAIATGPGSAEPHLAKGPDGAIVLSWLEPVGEKTQLKFSRLEAGTWSEPGMVAEGDNWFVNWADFPSVVPISGSLWAAHWLAKREGGVYAYDVAVSISRDAGTSWSGAITPHGDNTATEHGFVSMFPWQGGVGVVWLDGRKTSAAGGEHDHGESGGMTLRSAVISPQGQVHSEAEMDDLVCDCCQTGVAVSSQGPVAVYRNRTESEIRDIYLARSVDNQWLEGEPVNNDGWEISGCPVNGPAIAASENAVAVAWFTMAENTPRVRFAWSHDSGASFESAIDIAEESPTGRVDVAILEDGGAIVSWLDQAKNDQGLIRFRRILLDNRLGPVREITHTSLSRPAGFPQLVQDGNSLVVAWTDVTDEKSRVRSARIPLGESSISEDHW